MKVQLRNINTIVISRTVRATVIACGRDSVPSTNSSTICRRSKIFLTIESTLSLNLSNFGCAVCDWPAWLSTR